MQRLQALLRGLPPGPGCEVLSVATTGEDPAVPQGVPQRPKGCTKWIKMVGFGHVANQQKIMRKSVVLIFDWEGHVLNIVGGSFEIFFSYPCVGLPDVTCYSNSASGHLRLTSLFSVSFSKHCVGSRRFWTPQRLPSKAANWARLNGQPFRCLASPWTVVALVTF